MRNRSFKEVSKISWSLQDEVPTDTQLFNTEVFYGKMEVYFQKLNLVTNLVQVIQLNTTLNILINSFLCWYR